ncbi:MAG TPA: tol-pal system protein YbgF [Candidatus Hydrogenedentes bacterium]|nr:tol-pal system protein YbgF [Candidatus Hydrogenedentota bacterium]HOV72944.1 tol-pal system protein YbgF [Candidatus Hydrogenedentota bacterium]HPC15790.1 tol-pal system protein YbgF [Candidatus Hydrogenedentota bacterium]HRT19802.1 tol-pal system protein YbgF [Candidatus Hydrogenedentota bacterium]HRT64575.1 tol-pal system protein YbgF [Candidatus Hydrogenedentota bacterium]
MRSICWTVAVALSVVFLTAGCGTMGGGQKANAIYDTQRRVASLDKQLSGSVEKLNQNTAELIARLDATDQQLKSLQSQVEESAAKSNLVEKKLDNLTNSLARYFRSGAMPPPAAPGGGEIPPPTGEPLVYSPSREATPAPAPGPAAPAAPLPPPSATSAASPAPAATPAAPIAAAPAAPIGTGNPEADYTQAQKSYASENYKAALEQFDAFLTQYPTSENAPNALFWKAKALQSLEQHEQAIAEFEKLRTNYPTSVRVPYAMLYQAICQAKLGQTARASELMQEVIRNYPMTPAADQAKTEIKRLKPN